MNVIDFLLFVIILLFAFAGYQKGFISGTIDLLLLALGLTFAFWAFRYVAAFFENRFVALGIWTMPVSFILSYIFGRAILSFIAAELVRRLPRQAQHNTINRTLGIFPGAIKGVIYAAIISSLLLALPMFDGLSAKTRESTVATTFSPYVERAEEKLAPVFDDAINHSLNKLTVEPQSGKTVNLRFSVKNPKVREDLEARMLTMVNEERQKEGLHPLKADPEMREVARAHSGDMFARGYFSHINPEGKTPAERARAARIRFLTVGENLALAPTLQMAHTGLMNSPGHRANILRKTFGRVGIGILDGGRRGLMVTQNFRN